MAQDSFTVVSSKSWFSRVISSFVGVLVGLALIPGSIFLLSWNENRSVVTERSLKEGAAIVISADAGRIDPANEGRLVHVTGEAVASAEVVDELFGVSAPALRLARQVEAYQWKETESSEERTKLGGGTETVTTYSYERTWSDRIIDSGSFQKPEGHQNPTQFRADSRTFLAADVTLGAFTLPERIVRDLPGEEPLELRDTALENLSADLTADAKVSGGRFYFGADPANPAIGDERVSFEVVKPGAFSVLARQTGSTFASYRTRAGDEIERVEAGTVTATEMFRNAASENVMLTWLLRLAGFVLMVIGFACVLGPLSVLASVIPFLGSLVGLGTGFLSFLLGLVGSLLTIAVAWVAVRPLFGVTLIVLAVLAVFFAGRFAAGRARRKAA